MTDNDRLGSSLKRPVVPKDLAEKIRSNWQAQQARETASQKGYRAVASFFIVTSLLVSSLFIYQINTTPSLISAARQDILKDDTQSIGLSVPLQTIVTGNLLYKLEKSSIQMTKNCTLTGNQTVHIKIADKQQAPVHLFLKQGDFNLTAWQPKSGENTNISWKIISPQKHLSVLVISTSSMNNAKIDAFIQRMFYS